MSAPDVSVAALVFPGDPLPLSRVPALPPFPTEALGGALAEYVGAVAVATQTDPGMAGTLALGALAAAAGGRAVVEVRAGWREPVNLYACAAASPGTRKSGVFRALMDPLREAEKTLTEAARPRVIEAQTTRDVAQRAAEAAVAKAGKAGAEHHDAALADAIGAHELAAAVEVPTMPRLLADDVTPEAMASLLAENGGRLAVTSAEGGLFDVLAGRYSKGVNLDAVLKGHAGDTLRVDRKGRPPEYVEAPALTLALTVQPAVLETIGRNSDFAGRGLLARFLFALPTNTVGRRKIAPPPVPDALREQYADRLRALAEGLAGWEGDPAVILLHPDAAAVLLAAEEALEPRLGPGGSLAPIVEWASKSMGAAARVAALLHLAEHGASVGPRLPVTAATMRSALALLGYFTVHALAVFELMGADHGLDDARTVLRHVHARGLDRESERNLFTALPRSRFPAVEVLREALAALEEHGWAAREPAPEHGGPGRKPSPAWLFRAEPVAALLRDLLVGGLGQAVM